RVIRGLIIKTPIRIFAPDEVAQLVCPIKVAWLKNFLMQPRAIEAGGHGTLNVGLQFVIRRRSPDAVGEKSMIQNQPLKNMFAIDQNRAACDGNFTQAEIAG